MPPAPPPRSPAALQRALRSLAETCARAPEEGRALLRDLTLSRQEALALLSGAPADRPDDLPARPEGAAQGAAAQGGAQGAAAQGGAQGVAQAGGAGGEGFRARALATYYAEALAPAFVAEGCAELGRAFREGWREVVVDRVGPNQGARNAPGDLKLLLALPARPPLYVARWRPPGQALGLRVSGFVWAGGRWRALLKLGELLEPWRAEELARAEARAAAEGAP